MVKRYKNDKNSAKIEASRSRLEKVSDPTQLSKIFFPMKSAKQKRAAFLAIIYEIRNSSLQKAWPNKLNKIPKKYNINKTCYFEARAKMHRIGLIAKYTGYWTFSDRFENAWKKFITKLESLRYPAENRFERGNELIFIENAKREDIYEQIRKKKDRYADDKND